MVRDVTVSTLLLSIVLLTVLTIIEVNSFEYSGYCQKMCMWGRGGNLCKCNAVHFAGKRSSFANSDVTDSPDVLDLAADVGDVANNPDDAKKLRIWLARAALSMQDPTSDETQSGPSDVSRAKQLLLMALKKLSDNAQASSRQGNPSPWNDVTQDRIFNNI